jgi:hypothetical protein
MAVRVKILVLSILALAVLSIAIAGIVAANDKSRFKTALTGYEETPAVSSAGSGEFTATVDDENQTIHYTLRFDNLNSNVLFAHVHFGQRGVAGGVSAFLCGGNTKPAPCVPGTMITGTITPADIVGPAGQGIAPGEWNELVAAMRAGVAYANVHSMTQPAGEIRGQINDNDQRN